MGSYYQTIFFVVDVNTQQCFCRHLNIKKNPTRVRGCNYRIRIICRALRAPHDLSNLPSGHVRHTSACWHGLRVVCAWRMLYWLMIMSTDRHGRQQQFAERQARLQAGGGGRGAELVRVVRRRRLRAAPPRVIVQWCDVTLETEHRLCGSVALSAAATWVHSDRGRIMFQTIFLQTI